MDGEEHRQELSGFQADIVGFSGPFDLLCYLVENKQLEAAKISVEEVVKIYGAYLANTRKVSVAVVSEFLFMAASLVLNKILALLPGREIEEDLFSREDVAETDVAEKLSRYRPYRLAAAHLLVLKEHQDRLFGKNSLEEEGQAWDLGDLYGLCSLWWNLLESRKALLSPKKSAFVEDDGEWNGVPAPLPEEEQIEKKIPEILEKLDSRIPTSLSSFLGENRNVSVLVVTLLALLEMSRMGRIRIVQEELFCDVLIYLV